MDSERKIDVDVEKPALYRYDDILPAESALLAELLAGTEIQQLFESYYNLIKIPVAIIDLNANVLLSSRWQRICTQFHRKHPATCSRCLESDTQLALQLQAGKTYTVYACKNGMTDCASPIIIEGKHVANVFIGQFMTTEPDEAWFRRQAEECGFDVDDYIAAVREVPVVDEGRIPIIQELLVRMTRLLTNLSIDRKRAVESQARQSIILDAIPQSVFWKDINGRYLGCNAHFARDAGLATPDDVVGKTDFDLPWPRNEAEAYRADDQAVIAANQSKLHFIEPYQQADGSRFVVDTSKIPLVDGSNTPYGIVGIYEDISERILAEAALRESGEKYKALVDTTNTGYVILNMAGVVLDANKEYVYLTGHDALDEIKGRNVIEWTAPSDIDRNAAEIKKCLEKGYVRNLEINYAGPDGRVTPVEINANIIKDAGGGKILTLCRDITERKKSEQALINEVAVTGALLEAANVTSRNLVWEDVIGNVAGLIHGLTASKSVFVLQLVSDGLLMPQYAVGLSSDAITHFNSLRSRVADIKCFNDVLTLKTALMVKRDELQDFGLADHSGPLGLEELLIVPIPARDNTIGFICVNFETLPFDARVMAIIDGIAKQLGVAHDNSRLYLETQNKTIDLVRSLETMKVLSDIDRRILSTLDRDEVMSGSISQIRRIVSADTAGILLLEEDTERLVFRYGWSQSLKKGDTIPFDSCPGYPSIRSGKTLARKNIAEETALSDMDRALLDGGIKSDIFVPIICKDKGIGLLHIGSYRVAGFSLEDVRIVENLAAQLGIALSNATLLSDLEELIISMVTSFASTIDAKSPWTSGHSARVTMYAVEIAQKMGLGIAEIDRLKLSCLLHDIGKIGTSDTVLDKPEKLTVAEYALIKKHPEAGANILKPIRQFKDIIPVILHHHERWDGTGYPAGLSGEEIPLLARILCVADSYDAMMADRPYRPSPGADFTIDEFRRCSGTQFDPMVVDAFLWVLLMGEKPEAA